MRTVQPTPCGSLSTAEMCKALPHCMYHKKSKKCIRNRKVGLDGKRLPVPEGGSASSQTRDAAKQGSDQVTQRYSPHDEDDL
jgi:hypothetical protein